MQFTNWPKEAVNQFICFIIHPSHDIRYLKGPAKNVLNMKHTLKKQKNKHRGDFNSTYIICIWEMLYCWVLQIITGFGCSIFHIGCPKKNLCPIKRCVIFQSKKKKRKACSYAPI